MEPGFTFVQISCSSIFNCRIFCYLHQQQKKNNKKTTKKNRRKYIIMSSDTKRTDKITHYLYWPTFIKILLTILYYDYKCLCFINLLAGNYGIYGALRQSIMEKKWSIMKKWCQTLARSLEFCFFRFWLKIVIFSKNRKQGILRKSWWVK